MLSAHQLVANYITTPPAVFAHKLKKFLRDNPPPNGHRVTLRWKEVVIIACLTKYYAQGYNIV